MAIPRHIQLHGTGYTVGDIIDAAGGGGGGGYVPVPGSPTKFIRHVYTQPGSEDGTSPACDTNTGVVLYETQPGEAFIANVQVYISIADVGTACFVRSGVIMYNQKDINTNLGTLGDNGFTDNDALWSDAFVNASVTYYRATNQIIAILCGMSTANATTFTIELELVPIAPTPRPTLATGL